MSSATIYPDRVAKQQGAEDIRYKNTARSDMLLHIVYKIAKMSDCFTIRYFLSSTVTSVPEYLP